MIVIVYLAGATPIKFGIKPLNNPRNPSYLRIYLNCERSIESIVLLFIRKNTEVNRRSLDLYETFDQNFDDDFLGKNDFAMIDSEF